MQNRIRGEAAVVLPPPAPGEAPLPLDTAGLDRLPYLNAVWKETLRLYPPAASGGSRLTAAPLALPSDGSVLPAGTAIKMPHYPTLHAADHYAEPDVFRPDRWLPSASSGGGGGGGGGGSGGYGGNGGGGRTKTVGEQAWRPFGLGPASCIGRRLAEVEWKAAIVGLLAKYELRLAGSPDDVVPLDMITLRPSQLRVFLRRRRGEGWEAKEGERDE